MTRPLPYLLAALATGVAASAAAADRSVIADAGFRSHLANFEIGTERFINGDNTLWKENASKRDDVMIMGAWGAYEKGWPEVSKRYDWSGARFQNSNAKLDIEYLTSMVSGDLAFTVAIERSKVKLAGQDAIAPTQLRVTHIFRREGNAWKLVLRHADPLMSKTAPQATLQQ